MPRGTRSKKNEVVKEEIKSEDENEEEIDENGNNGNGVLIKTQTKARCVLIVPISVSNGAGKELVFARLRNPRTRDAGMFGFGDGEMFEVNRFSDDKRSWFIDDSVKSDGSLLMVTKVDALFYAIPYLFEAKHASPIDQVLIDEDFPETRRLCSCSRLEKLDLIADCKTTTPFVAWKWNESKALQWLEAKVSKLADHLKETNFNVATSAISSNYVKSRNTQVPESSFIRYAHGMISDYLPEALAAQLDKHLGLPPVEISSPSAEVTEPPAKRQKVKSEHSEPTEDYTKGFTAQPSAEKSKQSAKTKAMATAAKGSKNIASFFTKK